MVYTTLQTNKHNLHANMKIFGCNSEAVPWFLGHSWPCEVKICKIWLKMLNTMFKSAIGSNRFFLLGIGECVAYLQFFFETPNLTPSWQIVCQTPQVGRSGTSWAWLLRALKDNKGIPGVTWFPSIFCAAKAGPQQLLIMKFGGTSVGGGEQVLRCAGIVRQVRCIRCDAPHGAAVNSFREALPGRPVVVVSAMGKTTNALLSAARSAVETGEVDISAIRRACNHINCMHLNFNNFNQFNLG